MSCELCGAPTGWVPGIMLERANESKREAMKELRALRIMLDALIPEGHVVISKELTVNARFRLYGLGYNAPDRMLRDVIAATQTSNKEKIG